ncbi:MAG: 5'/3'-nucleotidase SurE [Anaerovoracaceae bacterium]|nr:5'/3'-nucleotidase SurE [Bacillota bacterium]MDY2670779.1 5'/3'-nucleotidase SurE [Anaerovoracaceae bacterium]
MNILVSNDDGINADGIRVLIKALSGVENANIYVCAPDGQRSASGHSITMSGGPIFVTENEVPGTEWAQSLSGTPADCVKSGIKRLKREKGIDIDVVFSGINHGSNIGTDVFYSGTVSAAVEGVLNGVPAVAVSVGTHHPTMEQLENCTTIIQDVCRNVLPKIGNGTVININFPDLPPSELKGVKFCRMGPREYDEKFDIETNPAGRKYYWYTGKLVHYDELPGDPDVIAYQDGYVVVTPIQLDMTDYKLMEAMKDWGIKA